MGFIPRSCDYFEVGGREVPARRGGGTDAGTGNLVGVAAGIPVSFLVSAGRAWRWGMRYPLPSDAPDGLGLLSILVHLGGPALGVAATGRGGTPNDPDSTAGV